PIGSKGKLARAHLAIKDHARSESVHVLHIGRELSRQAEPPQLLAGRHIPLPYRSIAADTKQRLAIRHKGHKRSALAMPPAHRPQPRDRPSRQWVAVDVEFWRLP